MRNLSSATGTSVGDLFQKRLLLFCLCRLVAVWSSVLNSTLRLNMVPHFVILCISATAGNGRQQINASQQSLGLDIEHCGAPENPEQWLNKEAVVNPGAPQTSLARQAQHSVLLRLTEQVYCKLDFLEIIKAMKQLNSVTE